MFRILKNLATAGFLISTPFILFSTTAFTLADEVPDYPAHTPQVIKDMPTVTLAFTENRGQWEDRILYRADAGGARIWFTKNGVFYEFTRHLTASNTNDILHKQQTSLSVPLSLRHEPNCIETMVIGASFVGANARPHVVGESQMAYRCNYFLGNDPQKWHTNVPNYRAVVFKGIYPGIDLRYHGNGRQMEYDLIISPGADPSRIRVHYEGTEALSVNKSGELMVKTRWSSIIELKPRAYQVDGSEHHEIECQYHLLSESEFGFDPGSDYDPELPLVIDPVLIYSTYLGGSSWDEGHAIVVDTAGYTYVTGETWSSNFPTENPYQGNQGEQGYFDAFVTKLDSSGSSLVYSTYLGGNSDDEGWGIAVEADGQVSVTGYTMSYDFPIENAYQANQGGGDAFVTRLSSSGDSLIFSTYLGGDSDDEGSGIAVAEDGRAYVTGYTLSSDFPTENPYQTNQGDYDVFVTALNNSGDSLIYSTYLGGSGEDYGQSIAVNQNGQAFLTGTTASSDFPTRNPYQTDQGEYDAFIATLSAAGDSLIYGTYLGGSYPDIGWGIALGEEDQTFVIGFTYSSDFPTKNAYQTYQGEPGYADAFVTKLGVNDDSLIYSTCLGGGSDDQAWGIAVDAEGHALVTGATESSDFPTKNPCQTYQGEPGYADAFVAKLSAAGDGLIYSTYLGGNRADVGCGIATGNNGYAFVTGWTYSSDFPTENHYQTDQGDCDVFVARIYDGGCCVGSTGNVDGDTDELVDISDLTALIDYLFITFTPPECMPEANCDGDPDGIVDIADLTALIDFLFITFTPPAECP